MAKICYNIAFDKRHKGQILARRDISVDSKHFSLSYKIMDNKSDSWVLFLHGWGATKELMESAFGTRFKSLNHLYVDLPGFGGSDNDFVLNTELYARIMQKFLTSLKITPQVIIAHSFGGKVATLLALDSLDSSNDSTDSPKNTQDSLTNSIDSPIDSSDSSKDSSKDSPNPPHLVLLSSAGLLKKQSVKVRLKIKFAKIARIFHLKAKFLISADAKGLSQNMYDTFKIVVREDFSERFALLGANQSKNTIKNPPKTLIFWGKDDEAVPLYLGTKMHSLIKDSAFFALKGDHFFFLDAQNAEFIESTTIKTLGL